MLKAYTFTFKSFYLGGVVVVVAPSLTRAKNQAVIKAEKLSGRDMTTHDLSLTNEVELKEDAALVVYEYNGDY